MNARPLSLAFRGLALATSIFATAGCGEKCKDVREQLDLKIEPATGPLADPCDAGFVKSSSSGRCIYPDGGTPPPAYPETQIMELMAQTCDQTCRQHWTNVQTVNACTPPQVDSFGYYVVHCDLTYSQCDSQTPALLK